MSLASDIVGNVTAPGFVTCLGNVHGACFYGDVQAQNARLGNAFFYGANLDFFGPAFFEKDIRVSTDSIIGGSLTTQEVRSVGNIICSKNFIGNGALLTNIPVPDSVVNELRALSERISALETMQ